MIANTEGEDIIQRTQSFKLKMAIIVSEENVVTCLLQTLCSSHVYRTMNKWQRRREVSVFDLSLTSFPFHSSLQTESLEETKLDSGHRTGDAPGEKTS